MNLYHCLFKCNLNCIIEIRNNNFATKFINWECAIIPNQKTISNCWKRFSRGVAQTVLKKYQYWVDERKFIQMWEVDYYVKLWTRLNSKYNTRVINSLSQYKLLCPKELLTKRGHAKIEIIIIGTIIYILIKGYLLFRYSMYTCGSPWNSF